MVDSYTKIILTIIAVCLMVITAKLSTTQANAGSNMVDVNISRIAGFSISSSYGLPIYLTKEVYINK